MPETSRRSPTRKILVRLGLALAIVDVLLVVATNRPGFSLAVEGVSVVALWVLYAARFAFDAPAALYPELLVFKLMDRIHPPAHDSVVFTGGSTIAHWISLFRDVSPIPVIRRGISGARLNQIAALMPPLIEKYLPRAVVLYAGENVFAGFLGSKPKATEAILQSFKLFSDEIHRAQPNTPIYFLSIKPPKARRAHAQAFSLANALVAEACAQDPRLHFVDVTTPLLDSDGLARGELFERDGIHLNGEGHRILADVVRKPFTSPTAAKAML